MKYKLYRQLTFLRDKDYIKNPLLWLIDEIRYSKFFREFTEGRH